MPIDEQFLYFVIRRNIVLVREELRILEFLQIRPAFRRFVLIEDNEGDMFYVEVERIADEDDERCRKAEEHAERRRVAPDLSEFFQDDRSEHAKHHDASRPPSPNRA